MNRWIPLLIGMAWVASLAHAAPGDDKETLRAAIHRLSDLGNYSWSVALTRNEDTGERFAHGPCEAKTEKSGLTWIRTHDSPQIEVIQKGGKMAVHLDDGWATEQELGGQARSRAHPNLTLIRSLKGTPHPAAQAQDLFKHAKDLTSGPEGYYKSALGPDDAKDLLHHSLRTGGRTPKISDAAGSVAFWVNDGALVKYEVHLQGSVTFDSPGSSTWSANYTRTVTLSALGTTKVEAPQEALQKLD